jgi:multiple sugar transport system permease protein
MFGISPKRLHQLKKFMYFVALSLIAAIWMVPILWTVSNSFRPEAAIRRDSAALLPIPFSLENWQAMVSSSMVPRWFINSIIVSFSRVALDLLVCSLAAFAFARIPFKGREIVFPLVLAGMMVPYQATFIPIYLMMAKLNWLNTYLALILPAVGGPFGVFLLTQFFKGIPRELEEAAYLDGAGRWTVFWQIIMPLSVPVLTTLGIFAFLGAWNDFLWPLISVTKREMLPITVGLQYLTTSWGGFQYYGKIMAAAWAGAIPVVIFFFFFQRQIVRGIVIGQR